MSKILVVDDAVDWRDTLAGLLRDSGYWVRTAANEEEALEAASAERFDFAVIDWRLKGDAEDDDSCILLSSAIRHQPRNKKVRVIVITGYKVKPRQIVRAVRYFGAIDLIEKGPDTAAQVMKVIESEKGEEEERAEIGIDIQVQLFNALVKYLTEEELETLCFTVHVDYGDLEGRSKSGKARALITHLANRNCLPALVEALKQDWIPTALKRIGNAEVQ